ncbi:hypothetical protein DFQ27_008735 [Actinomortierella ambigua]|uniref:RRM domain-containing protein n=1 Tax=Actinomortierella ambigua TaxID=1343610 RepID=A0A9P6QHR8_9FUNG|nr:hypothetical protein DFQ27_008735 [Actinomortierella ambigua]
MNHREPVTLFVKGFPLITSEEVKTMSIQVGAVSVRSMGPRNAKNAAFMDFVDRAAAERGIEALNAWTFPASPLSRLRAEFAKSKGSRVTESIPRPPSLASPTTISYYGSPTSASLVPTNPSAAVTTTKSTSDSTWSEPMQDVVSSQYGHNDNRHHHHPTTERDEYLEALLELRPYQKQAQTGFVNIMRAIKEHPALLGHVRLRMRELQLPDPFSTAAASSPATPMTATNKGMDLDLDPPPLSSLEMAVYLSDPLNYQPPPSKSVQNQQQQQSQESGGLKAVKPPTTLTTPVISSSLSLSNSIAAPQLHHDNSETSLLAAVDQWKKGSRVAEAKTKQITAAATAGAEKEKEVKTKGKRRMEQGQLSPRGIPENSNGQQSLSSDESEIESEPEQHGGGPKRRRLTREEAEEIVRQQEQLPILPSSPPLPQQQQQQQMAPSTHEKAKSSSSKGSASTSTKKELQAGSNEASKGATGQPPPQQQDKGRKKKKKRPKKKRDQLAKEEAAMDVEGDAPLTLSSDAVSEKSCKNGVSKLPGSTVSSAASAASAAAAATKAEETLPILPEAGTVTITAEHSHDNGDGRLEAAHKESGENEAVSTVAAPNDNITLLTENGSSLLSIPTTSSTTITATTTTTRSKAAPAPAKEAKGDQNLPLTTSARKRAQRKLRQEHGQHRRQQPAQNAALEGSDKTLNEDGKEMVVTKKKIPNMAPKKEDEDEEQKPQQPVSPQQPTMVEDALEDKGAQATTSADLSSLP